MTMHRPTTILALAGLLAAWPAAAVAQSSPSLHMRWRDDATFFGDWSVVEVMGQRAVFHLVLETKQEAEDARVRLYVDGVAQVGSGPWPNQNDTIQIYGTPLYTIGNRPALERSIEGAITYVAMYTVALTEAEIAMNVERLALDDDQ